MITIRSEEGRRRQENLNIILLSLTAGFALLNLIRAVDIFVRRSPGGLPFWATFGLLLFFFGLWRLNRSGRRHLAAWLLLGALAVPTVYCMVAWGIDLPAALLLTALLIMVAGAVEGTGALFAVSASAGIFIIAVSLLDQSGIIRIDSSWRADEHDTGDGLAYTALLLTITAAAWLFCRGLAESLARARRSEELLQAERDSLEIKVRERTEKLKELEAEKITRLYRFAEFGRLSSGIFHDLMNPLAAVSLNLEQLRDEAGKIADQQAVSQASRSLEEALAASRRMDSLLAAIRRQIANEDKIVRFRPAEGIRQTIQVLAYRARRARTEIVADLDESLEIEGDPNRFSQIAANLLANAIDACEERYAINESGAPETAVSGKIKADLKKPDDTISLMIEDNGGGIAPEKQELIWKPFFSTKSGNDRGLGLGLSSTKRLVEKYFRGRISVASQLGTGSRFTVEIPENGGGALSGKESGPIID